MGPVWVWLNAGRWALDAGRWTLLTLLVENINFKLHVVVVSFSMFPCRLLFALVTLWQGPALS